MKAATTAIEVATACKVRAEADYETFNMFVECYGPTEWLEFVQDYDVAEAFDQMDIVLEHWNEMRATEF